MISEIVIGLLIGGTFSVVVGLLLERSFGKVEAEADAAWDRLEIKVSALRAERDALLAERDRLDRQVAGIRGLVKVWEIEGDYEEHES